MWCRTAVLTGSLIPHSFMSLLIPCSAGFEVCGIFQFPFYDSWFCFPSALPSSLPHQMGIFKEKKPITRKGFWCRYLPKQQQVKVCSPPKIAWNNYYFECMWVQSALTRRRALKRVKQKWRLKRKTKTWFPVSAKPHHMIWDHSVLCVLFKYTDINVRFIFLNNYIPKRRTVVLNQWPISSAMKLLASNNKMKLSASNYP